MKDGRISRFFYVLALTVCMQWPSSMKAQPWSTPPILAEPDLYTWPTNAGRYLSSTFGETRSAHLHTGIDIKTWGKEGYDVYATRDGVLFRVQTGPSGYGNALYLKHDDGSFSVYAHLRNFIPEITRIVDSVRVPELRHDVDLIVEHHQIRFLKGQKIAYTGSTGIGPPHLHFELRTPDNVPYNPLYARFQVTDRIPPQLRALLVEEFRRETAPDANTTARIVRHSQTERNSGRSLPNGLLDFGVIESSGSLLLSVDASDRANDVSNVYAVYELQLFAGDSLLFASRASHLPFETSSHMFMDRHYEWLRTKRKGFQRLHVLEGNQLPVYRKTASGGVVNLPEGRHTLTVLARDYDGNETKGILTVDQKRPSYDLAIHDLSMLNVTSTAQTASLFKELLDKLDQRFSDTVIIDTLLLPGTSYMLETPDRRFFMEIPADALFEPLRLMFSISRTSDQDLTFLISPNPVPFASPVRIGALMGSADGFNAHSSDLKAGFSWLTDKPIATRQSASGRWVSFRSLEIGPFTTYVDTLSPAVSTPKRVVLPEGMASVEVRVTREISPIDRLSAAFEIDGIPGIPIYDPEYKSFRFYHPDVSLTSGAQVRFSVADQFGNRTSREWQYRDGSFTR